MGRRGRGGGEEERDWRKGREKIGDERRRVHTIEYARRDAISERRDNEELRMCEYTFVFD